MIRFVRAVVLLLTIDASAATPPAAYLQVGREYQVPAAVLYTLALTASASRTGDAVRPWPWMLTIDGKPQRYASQTAAAQALRQAIGHGNKPIDVGLMQLSWAHHGTLLYDAWHALDPWYNLRVGAYLLRGQYQRDGDWALAGARLYAPASKRRQLPLKVSRRDQQRFAALIADAARTHRLDAALLNAVISAESRFKPRARSHAGAQGLMQLMPATAQRFGVTDPYDPTQNIDAGARYLRWLLDAFGDLRLALAGYNAGEGAVSRYGNQVPPYRETREYVPRVLAMYRYFQLRTLLRELG